MQFMRHKSPTQDLVSWVGYMTSIRLLDYIDLHHTTVLRALSTVLTGVYSLANAG